MHRDQIVQCILINLGANVAKEESVNPIGFGGEKVKVQSHNTVV